MSQQPTPKRNTATARLATKPARLAAHDFKQNNVLLDTDDDSLLFNHD